MKKENRNVYIKWVKLPEEKDGINSIEEFMDSIRKEQSSLFSLGLTIVKTKDLDNGLMVEYKGITFKSLETRIHIETEDHSFNFFPDEFDCESTISSFLENIIKVENVEEFTKIIEELYLNWSFFMLNGEYEWERGTKENPIEISNLEEFLEADITGGKTYFKLTEDIDLEGLYVMDLKEFNGVTDYDGYVLHNYMSYVDKLKENSIFYELDELIRVGGFYLGVRNKHTIHLSENNFRKYLESMRVSYNIDLCCVFRDIPTYKGFNVELSHIDMAILPTI